MIRKSAQRFSEKIAAGMFVLWRIVDPGHLDGLLEAVFAIVSKQVGLVSVTDVEVVRPEHF